MIPYNIIFRFCVVFQPFCLMSCVIGRYDQNEFTTFFSNNCCPKLFFLLYLQSLLIKGKTYYELKTIKKDC